MQHAVSIWIRYLKVKRVGTVLHPTCEEPNLESFTPPGRTHARTHARMHACMRSASNKFGRCDGIIIGRV